MAADNADAVEGGAIVKFSSALEKQLDGKGAEYRDALDETISIGVASIADAVPATIMLSPSSLSGFCP